MIAAFKTADGTLVGVVESLNGLGTGVTSKPLPAGYVADTWVWDKAARTFVEDPARVEAELIGLVKDEGERRRMMVLSPGGGKKMVYNAKLAEVEAYKTIASGVVGGALNLVLGVIAGLPLADRKRKFRYALAEQARRGEPSIAPAIARFEAGADAAHTEAARIEAIVQAAIAAIKAASTAASKRAAYAAINWAWQPA